MVFIPWIFTHATIDLCSPTIGVVYLGKITRAGGKCIEFPHAKCENEETFFPTKTNCPPGEL